MLPRVIISVGASVDGRTVGPSSDSADMGLYYELVGRWAPDVHLSGSETLVVAGFGADPEVAPDWRPPEPAPDDPRALLVVVDSRGRIRNWPGLWTAGYWRGMVALCSAATPAEYLTHLDHCGVEYIITGDAHVDLRAALEALAARCGARVVHVDSGGTLNGVLLRAGLVDEVAVLVWPSLAGGPPLTLFREPSPIDDGPASAPMPIPLELVSAETLPAGRIWLHYRVTGHASEGRRG